MEAVWSTTSIQGRLLSLKSVQFSAICGPSLSSESGTRDISEKKLLLRHTDATQAPFLITGQHILSLFTLATLRAFFESGCHLSYCPALHSLVIWISSLEQRWQIALTLCWESTLYCNPLAGSPEKSGTWKLTAYNSSHYVKICSFTILALNC